MRNNLELALAHRLRNVNPSYATVTMILNGPHTIGAESPSFLFLDAGGSVRDVYLPAIIPGGGQSIRIFNIGDEALTIRTAGGSVVATLGADEVGEFTSSVSVWYYSRVSAGTVQYRIETSATVNFLASDVLVVVNRGADDPITVNLCSLIVAAGQEKHLAVWDNYASEMTINASAGETIYGLSSWSSVPLGPARGGGILTFVPILDLNGWVIR